MIQKKRTRGGLGNALPSTLPQTPAEYIDLLRHRWYWVVICIVIGSIASQVALRMVPKRYVSRTVVLVQSDKVPRNFIPRLTTGQPSDRLRTVHEEILARPRVERILDELDPYPELLDMPRSDLVDLVRRRTVILLHGRDAFVVEYTDTSPERAQSMATRLASLFIEETSGDRQRQAAGAQDFIDSQLSDTKEQLAKVEAQLSVKKQQNMGMLPNQLQANLATLQRLQIEHQSVTEQIRSAKDRRSLLERQLSLQQQMNEPEAQLVPDLPGGVTTATAPASGSLPALRAYLDQLLTRYTDQHPEVAATMARIERLEREQTAEIAEASPSSVSPGTPSRETNEAETETEGATPTASTDFLVSDLRAQVAAVDRDIELLEGRETEVRQEIGRYQARVERIPEVEQELQSLERDYALISKYYSELLSRKLEAATAGDVERKWEEQFTILDPAQVPQNPSYPKASMFLLMGTLFGVGGGLALAFAIEIIDPTIKSVRELESLLPYPVVLTLPRVKRSKWRRRRGNSGNPMPPPAHEEGSERLSAAS